MRLSNLVIDCLHALSAAAAGFIVASGLCYVVVVFLLLRSPAGCTPLQPVCVC